MKAKIDKTYQRSIYKTFTWRVIASLDTAILGFLFSYYGDELFEIFNIGFEITATTVRESIFDGVSIGIIEIFT